MVQWGLFQQKTILSKDALDWMRAEGIVLFFSHIPVDIFKGMCYNKVNVLSKRVKCRFGKDGSAGGLIWSQQERKKVPESRFAEAFSSNSEGKIRSFLQCGSRFRPNYLLVGIAGPSCSCRVFRVFVHNRSY